MSLSRGARQLMVVGGGLAGCEAAWQAARAGSDVALYEMRPLATTPAHRTDMLAELVCSNSLGSNLPDRAAGLLKAELRALGSLVMAAADATAVPAGGALAVDRAAFSEWVTAALASHRRVRIVRGEVTEVPATAAILATGPLTSQALAADLARLAGWSNLFFFDAVSPIVTVDSVDMTIAFRQSRYGRGEREDGDYLNCPMDVAAFERFAAELAAAERIELRGFELADPALFEACLPIESLADRGSSALLFGPLRPVGLRDPRTGRRPYAVAQLRQDDAAGSLYNLVGFQTNLRWPEQERVFRLIPGLEQARFERLGQMHRNTYVRSPELLEATMQTRFRRDLWLAGQITGIEGYVGNAASGLVAGVNAARALEGQAPLTWPPTTMIGALCRYICQTGAADFQPMKANMGLLPALTDEVRGRRPRAEALARRALADLHEFLASSGWTTVEACRGPSPPAGTGANA